MSIFKRSTVAADEYIDNMLLKRFLSNLADGDDDAFRVMSYYRGWLSKSPDRQTILSAISMDAEWACKYAKIVLRGRWPEAEPVIATDPEWAYYYALYNKDDLARFPAGEEAIARDPMWAYHYALNVIKDRWPEGEPAIATCRDIAYFYAMDILKDRFVLGEKMILSSIYREEYMETFGLP